MACSASGVFSIACAELLSLPSAISASRRISLEASAKDKPYFLARRAASSYSGFIFQPSGPFAALIRTSSPRTLTLKTRRSRQLLSTFHRLIPIVVVSRKMTCSIASRVSSVQRTLRIHAGRFFFMKQGS